MILTDSLLLSIVFSSLSTKSENYFECLIQATFVDVYTSWLQPLTGAFWCIAACTVYTLWTYLYVPPIVGFFSHGWHHIYNKIITATGVIEEVFLVLFFSAVAEHDWKLNGFSLPFDVVCKGSPALQKVEGILDFFREENKGMAKKYQRSCLYPAGILVDI